MGEVGPLTALQDAVGFDFIVILRRLSLLLSYFIILHRLSLCLACVFVTYLIAISPGWPLDQVGIQAPKQPQRGALEMPIRSLLTR